MNTKKEIQIIENAKIVHAKLELKEGVNYLQHIAHKEGTDWVPIKEPCKMMGICESTQRKKIISNGRASYGLITATGGDNKRYKMFSITKEDVVPHFLNLINPNKVKPECKETVILFQEQMAKALNDFVWLGVNKETQDSQADEIKVLKAEIVLMKNELEKLRPMAKEIVELRDRYNRLGQKYDQALKRLHFLENNSHYQNQCLETIMDRLDVHASSSGKDLAASRKTKGVKRHLRSIGGIQ